MTHTPPVPAGNQSPYPLQEPPHAAVTTPVVARDDNQVVAGHDEDGTPTSRLAELPLGVIGAVVGIGAAVIGGVLIALRGTSKARGSKRRGKARRG